MELWQKVYAYIADQYELRRVENPHEVLLNCLNHFFPAVDPSKTEDRYTHADLLNKLARINAPEKKDAKSEEAKSSEKIKYKPADIYQLVKDLNRYLEGFGKAYSKNPAKLATLKNLCYVIRVFFNIHEALYKDVLKCLPDADTTNISRAMLGLSIPCSFVFVGDKPWEIFKKFCTEYLNEYNKVKQDDLFPIKHVVLVGLVHNCLDEESKETKSTDFLQKFIDIFKQNEVFIDLKEKSRLGVFLQEFFLCFPNLRAQLPQEIQNLIFPSMPVIKPGLINFVGIFKSLIDGKKLSAALNLNEVFKMFKFAPAQQVNEIFNLINGFMVGEIHSHHQIVCEFLNVVDPPENSKVLEKILEKVLLLLKSDETAEGACRILSIPRLIKPQYWPLIAPALFECKAQKEIWGKAFDVLVLWVPILSLEEQGKFYQKFGMLNLPSSLQSLAAWLSTNPVQKKLVQTEQAVKKLEQKELEQALEQKSSTEENAIVVAIAARIKLYFRDNKNAGDSDPYQAWVHLLTNNQLSTLFILLVEQLLPWQLDFRHKDPSAPIIKLLKAVEHWAMAAPDRKQFAVALLYEFYKNKANNLFNKIVAKLWIKKLLLNLNPKFNDDLRNDYFKDLDELLPYLQWMKDEWWALPETFQIIGEQLFTTAGALRGFLFEKLTTAMKGEPNEIIRVTAVKAFMRATNNNPGDVFNERIMMLESESKVEEKAQQEKIQEVAVKILEPMMDLLKDNEHHRLLKRLQEFRKKLSHPGIQKLWAMTVAKSFPPQAAYAILLGRFIEAPAQLTYLIPLMDVQQQLLKTEPVLKPVPMELETEHRLGL